jgi:2-dehydro-3-deoxyphosphogluconate aldolase/(4S)-4-hydroxy-2-oxoglutarate aldolase
MSAEFQTWFDEHLGRSRVMVILRGFTPERTLELARVGWDNGVALVEVPVQGVESLHALERVAAAAPGEHTPVGAGTVITTEQVRLVRDAGARFTVAPGFDLEVSAASHDCAMPHLPGVATATEVQRALAHGHRWQKLFPASVLTASLIPALHGPFPEVRFVATGGVSPANAAEFIDAGAAAVSLGASFADASPDELSRLVRS